MFKTDGPRVFGLPPGVDFPAALVAGLRARLAGQPPLAMARVRLVVNTTRMARRLRELFDDGPAALLPRIHLVTDLSTLAQFPDLPAPVSPLHRRLELVDLLSKLLDQAPDLAPRAALYDLADSLARLMDEMQGEGVPPEAIAALDVTDESGHWRRAQQFLSIVQHYFEDTHPAPDAQARSRALVSRLAALWQDAPPPDPVIVAGSTGSRGTTLALMKAVAALPQGALVLPGYDFDMPLAGWDDLQGALTGEDHPQYRFRRIVDELGIGPADVQPWSDATPPAPARNKALSLALRPAPVTSCWLAEGPHLPALEPAFADVTLVEAPNRRAEALAIALRLRAATEAGVTAALITPDRLLGREVTAALDRWAILPDDSGGTPLHLTAPGRFLRHVAALMTGETQASALLELLKHPLTHTGQDRGPHLLLTRDLELHIRRKGMPYPTRETLHGWALKHREKHEDDRVVGWAAWVAETMTALVSAPAPMEALIDRHIALAERIAAGPDTLDTGELWLKKAGTETHRLIQHLRDSAGLVAGMTPRDYADFLGKLLQSEQLRDRDAPRPDVLIWGTLEARVMGADLLILAGLNEGTWPEMPSPDPWLNRRLRHQAGLLLPERQIGLSAHDFQIAACAREVWLTRSLKSDDAETVPSRWLNRLSNLLNGLPDLGGPEVMTAMKTRGEHWLAQARALETPLRTAPARRPSPRPPVEARPKDLYVTQIRDLVRDPYKIYARKVLQLYPLDPLDQAPDALLRGIVMHDVLEAFIRQAMADRDHLSVARLLDLLATKLDDDIPWHTTRALWQARLARVAERFVTEEQGRLMRGTPALFEATGGAELAGMEFTLKGRADRVDVTPGGQLRIYDYKTGTPPTVKQQKTLDKQLLLLSAIAERSGFRDQPPAPVAEALFVTLSASASNVEAPLDEMPTGVVWEELTRLIRHYSSPEQGYTARRAMVNDSDTGDYDHLARFGEWDVTDPADPEDFA
ncbi:double-strand break repair protein AddB [Mesobacterium pallidum]|uniref:double-strand break repair protein AddB n=1 Tax=Mesobacterium pallidum TaxID=2872037 RepID=UPI001EE39C02|nr:double-strand break repair protein AddB [Mesobacterium pallidum]